MDFTFKTLSAAHAADWQALRLEGTRDFPMGFLIGPDDVLKTSDDRVRDILDAGTARGVFADDVLIGFCGYRPERLERTRHRAEIGPFFVSAKYHGTGAARFLMQGVIDEARDAGIEQLELFVDTENHRAIRFYEREGFERVATHPDGVRINGKSRDDHFYVLRIKPVAVPL